VTLHRAFIEDDQLDLLHAGEQGREVTACGLPMEAVFLSTLFIPAAASLDACLDCSNVHEAKQRYGALRTPGDGREPLS
jgi:hypothetical protein